MKTAVATSDVPAAIGPYSQAVRVDNMLYCSGQIPLRPDGSGPAEGIEAQTRQVLANVHAVLKAAGATPAHVVKTTIFLTDLADFQTVNTLYAEFFSEPFPARSTIQVAALPKGASVEIEVMARIST